MDRIIFFSETSLRRAVREFNRHHHRERNHQGLANRLIEPGMVVGRVGDPIHSREGLRSMLRYYYRDAA